MGWKCKKTKKKNRNCSGTIAAASIRTSASATCSRAWSCSCRCRRSTCAAAVRSSSSTPTPFSRPRSKQVLWKKKNKKKRMKKEQKWSNKTLPSVRVFYWDHWFPLTLLGSLPTMPPTRYPHAQGVEDWETGPMRRCLVSVFFFSETSSFPNPNWGRYPQCHSEVKRLPPRSFFWQKKSFVKKSSRIEGLAQCDVA